jgi:subtilisin family serine protease
LNDGGAIEGQSFAYPETTQPVRLYLIDSPVAHLGANEWFDQNPKLSLEASFEIGDGESDPSIEHGTKMLSLIAGPLTGAAAGTPIQLVTYDDYPLPGGAEPTVSRMIEALYQAIEYQEKHSETPAVICLASGSSNPLTSVTLKAAIEEAVGMGITVVVSAGNSGQNAASFVPSAYGTIPGVICVGASDANNVHLPNSNFGDAVDLYAPGFQVRTVNHTNPFSTSYGTMSGTSPATALTAAAAIIELSKNPSLTPAQVEAALKGESVATVAVAATASIRHLKASSVERDGQRANVVKLRAALDRAGIPHIANESHIIPVIIGDPVKCRMICDILLADWGIYVQPINYPTVPRGTERLRITPGPLHSEADIAHLVTALDSLWRHCALAHAVA